MSEANEWVNEHMREKHELKSNEHKRATNELESNKPNECGQSA